MRYFSDKKYFTAFITGAVFLVVASYANSLAVQYANERVSNSVTDIILSNTPVFDVDGFFIYGAIALIVIATAICVWRLRAAPFVMKSVALLVVIRAAFVSMTHISPYPEHVAVGPDMFTKLFPSVFTGSDLFFSGHTAIPFLLALMFWDNVYLRFLFLGFSAAFAVVVLLGHLHYTIDVAAAYFITYTIFVLAKKFFRTDWERMQER
ncbi:MAG: hypothetical protein KGI73_01315 [Patescibacteria group bacterium]|nr:hypothetical protein [Patescibacteria group bacterium]